MTTNQLLIWTALPNGYANGRLSLSVFLAPQLSATTPVGHSYAPLSLFPDFVNWPQAINQAPDGPPTFSVIFEHGFTAAIEAAAIVTPAPPNGINASNAWAAIFDPTGTKVDPFAFEDLSATPVHSYPVEGIEAFVSSLYGTIGTISPKDPLYLIASRNSDFRSLRAGSPEAQAVVNALLELAQISGYQGSLTGGLRHAHNIPNPVSSFTQLKAFHSPLANPSFAIPVNQVLDFHKGLSGLNSFPILLRLFNLVYDLSVPVPAGISPGTIKVAVVPSWSSQLGSASTDVSPWTLTNYSATQFAPAPSGPDLANQMLALNDTNRFTVSNLDTDLAGDRLFSTGVSLSTTMSHQGERAQKAFGNIAPGVLALTVPALRSSGPQIIWNGYAGAGGAGFAGRIQGQSDLHASLVSWLGTRSDFSLPVFTAEHLIRGYRIDVFSFSESVNGWRSLHGRYGTYTFGPNGSTPISFKAFDEGLMSPSAFQKADSTISVPPDLWVHESIARWRGWGLSAQRPGEVMDRYSNTTTANSQNVPTAPVPGAAAFPQLATTFGPPSATAGPEYRFPKLRFGYQYQLRARAVDLAGNSLPVSSTDSSSATPLFTHYRYEPVRPPVMAGVAPFTPGESTHLLVLLDDQFHAPGINGRWLFPPSVSELLSEEHGMLDGFSWGNPPDPTQPMTSDPATWQLLANLDKTNLAGVLDKPYDWATGVPIGTFDEAHEGVPYFTGTPKPWTPWFPDPLSFGPALTGLPGASGPTLAPWHGVWPEADPVLVVLSAGSDYTTNYVAPVSGAPGTFNVTLPPAGVANVRLSSALSNAAFAQMGVWQWFGPGSADSVITLAGQGQIWLLSPFQVFRMVHAVRTPLLAPQMGSPITSRVPGDLAVDIDDPQFQVDEPSTSHVDVAATWTDRYDNPSDPASDPSALPIDAPARVAAVTASGPAFRLTIPDPNPVGPDSGPMTIHLLPEQFAVTGVGNGSGHDETATHHIGDTKHHLVHYTATGTSRFAEMFTKSVTVDLTADAATNPLSNVTLGDVNTGLSAASVVVMNGGGTLAVGTDYVVDESSRVLTLLSSAARPMGSILHLTVHFQPTVTSVGDPVPVHVLSSARPIAPVISQIIPAWQVHHNAGSVATGLRATRTGGYLRVYFERPWFSSGDGELVGVVTTVTTAADAYTSTFPSTAQQGFVTMMGIDPINYVGAGHTPWPVVPGNFTSLAVIPEVPYRPPYAHPPQVTLKEDPLNLYQVWPYDVHYDSSTQRWYADIAPRPGITENGTYAPPPGYFIRLALVRFQPFSTYQVSSVNGGLEVSPVVLATFAQPVPDRSVTVVANSGDKSGLSVLVEVSGPGYQGFRPPMNEGGQQVLQYDADNLYAPSNPSIYHAAIGATKGTKHSSTMVAEIQIHDPVKVAAGLTGELAWKSVTTPVTLPPTFSSETLVTWGSVTAKLHGPGVVALPHTLSSGVQMRLRLSEIDYYQGASAPTIVDTRYRRPFVSHIPLN